MVIEEARLGLPRRHYELGDVLAIQSHGIALGKRMGSITVPIRDS
jgi:hypothetical protein